MRGIANLERSPFIAYGIVFLLALVVTLLLIPMARWLGQHFGVTAKLGGRHQTEGDARRVSKLGGIALFGGFAAAALAAQALPVPRLDPNELMRFVGLMLGAFVIFIVGLLDDIFTFRSLPQYVGQSVAAACAIAFQIFIEYFNNPLTGAQTDNFPYIVTVTITYFWLVGMMNTMNFLDGLDGLAAGVTLIAGLMLFINSAFRVEPAQASVSLLHLALIGTAAGFLLYNFYPARIFMGGGALLLGYLLGSLSIIGGAKMATILLVMGLPLLDVGWQVINRLRHGRSPFEGDRGHLHFRLLDLGFSQRQIVIGYYVFCSFFGALTLVTTSQLFKFIALGVMMGLTAGGFVLIGRMGSASRQTGSASAGDAP
jgi:UDP-GlcNAc:undecaprenyl-phosphate GlcNAc-1-phosphate transferase